MILHLQDDPTSTLNADTLRFVYKEWPQLKPSMNTKTTVKNVKKKLLQLNVAYLSRTQENDWIFWNDYTIEGLFNIQPIPIQVTRTNRNDISGNVDESQSQSSNSEASSQADLQEGHEDIANRQDDDSSDTSGPVDMRKQRQKSTPLASRKTPDLYASDSDTDNV